MTVLTFNDAYTDKPTTPRGRLEQELRRLKVLMWSDPADSELRARIAALEAELAALNREGTS